MNQDNKIDVFARENIENVIHIVNNLVYNGNNETIPETDKRLKEKLKTAFVDFFGKKHEDKVKQRIDKMEINRIFHILGNRNSISQLLLDEKAKNYPINPEILPHYIITPPEQLLEEARTNSLSAERLEEVCKTIGFKVKHLKNPATHNDFIGALREYYNNYQKKPYSKDPVKNKELQFLEQYVESYKDYLIQNQYSLADYTDNLDLICSQDPIFSELSEHIALFNKKDLASDLFDINSDCGAFAQDGDIYLGINPPSCTIIHEAFHAVVTIDNQEYTGINSINSRWFNEAVTEYYSQRILKKFFSSEENSLTLNNDNFLAYSMIVEKMSNFLKVFAPEFKEALMNDDPITATQTLISSDTFNSISNCLDIIFTQAVGPNSNILIKEYKEYTKKDVKQAQQMLGQAQHISTFRNKSALENLFNIISMDAEYLANTIKKSNSPVFKKIANAIYSFTSTINTHTQKRVKKILNSPPTERDRLINIIRNALLTDEELDLSSIDEENITLYFPGPKGQLSIDDPER